MGTRHTIHFLCEFLNLQKTLENLVCRQPILNNPVCRNGLPKKCTKKYDQVTHILTSQKPALILVGSPILAKWVNSLLTSVPAIQLAQRWGPPWRAVRSYTEARISNKLSTFHGICFGTYFQGVSETTMGRKECGMTHVIVQVEIRSQATITTAAYYTYFTAILMWHLIGAGGEHSVFLGLMCALLHRLRLYQFQRKIGCNQYFQSYFNLVIPSHLIYEIISTLPAQLFFPQITMKCTELKPYWMTLICSLYPQQVQTFKLESE